MTHIPRPKDMRANFPLRIPDDLKGRLSKEAERHNTNMTAVILSGTKDKVAELERKEPLF